MRLSPEEQLRELSRGVVDFVSEKDLLERAKIASVEAGLRAAWEAEKKAGETGQGQGPGDAAGAIHRRASSTSVIQVLLGLTQ